MIKNIINNIYQIDLGVVNCFLVDNDGALTLIDTGIEGAEKKIFKALAEIGRGPSDIKQVILTHLHPDHAGSAAAIQKLLNVPVYAHHADAVLIEQGIGMREPMTRMPGFISWMIYNLMLKKAPKTITPVSNIIDLSDGQLLPILTGVKIIHSPGHSAGHICLLFEQEQLLIAGDICMNTNGLEYSILYEDVALAKQTIKDVSKCNFNIACFGHGKPVIGNASKKMIEKFS
jgi:glyoxylase-like metal-dependent hydrolase (beta-lactamase superfamily II)